MKKVVEALRVEEDLIPISINKAMNKSHILYDCIHVSLALDIC
jgi:hypothetical protein